MMEKCNIQGTEIDLPIDLIENVSRNFVYTFWTMAGINIEDPPSKKIKYALLNYTSLN